MRGPEDDAGLAGKVAIISGGGAAGDGIGNGRAAAILLARAGAKVLVADRELELAERTVEMVRAEGASFYGQCAIGPEAVKEGPAARHAPPQHAAGPGRQPLKAGEVSVG